MEARRKLLPWNIALIVLAQFEVIFTCIMYITLHGCICEILTGGSEFGTHTDQTGKGIRCSLGGGVAAY